MNNQHYILLILFDSRFYIREWEEAFEKRTGIELINPFYDITRKDITPIDAGRKERYEMSNVTKREIISRDVMQIVKSDGVVAIIDGNKSYGTIMEMVYAKRFERPVWSVVTTGDEGHPWIYGHSTEVFTSLEDVENHLEKFYKG